MAKRYNREEKEKKNVKEKVSWKMKILKWKIVRLFF